MEILSQKKIMNKQELLETFPNDLTENYITKDFKKAQQKMQKKGYELTKVKVANEWQYTVVTNNTTERNEYSIITMEQLEQYQSYEFGIFLLLSAMPMRVFVGSYKEFFNLIYLNYTKSNKEAFKKSLDKLEQEKIIFYKIDPTNEDHFIIAFTSAAEDCLRVGVKNYIIEKSAQIAKKYNNHDFFSLVKVWIGVCYCTRTIDNEGVIKIAQLEELTGMSKYKISKALKTLFQEEQIKDFGLKYHVDLENDEIRCKGREMYVNEVMTEESREKKNIVILRRGDSDVKGEKIRRK